MRGAGVKGMYLDVDPVVHEQREEEHGPVYRSCFARNASDRGRPGNGLISPPDPREVSDSRIRGVF